MLEIHPILKGVLFGVIATVMGWLKNSNPDRFHIKGLIIKLPAGIVVGLIASYQGIEFNAALEWASGIGVVEVIDKVVKILIRRVYPKWMSFANQSYTLDSNSVEMFLKFADGRGITREDVIRGTETFRQITDKFLDDKDPFDKEFKKHADFVANQILQNIRKHQYSSESIENIGKMLFRLFQVYRNYRGDKKEVTLEEWLGEIRIIAEMLKKVFESGTE